MSESQQLQSVRAIYAAYENGEREVVERLLADDYEFFSPPDPGIGRERYFERCWPAHETIAGFEFVRLIERGEEVVITYESTKTDGRRFRNTEVQTFAGETIAKTEVYFGWDL